MNSGFLWKVGGSGLKMKHWKRRFFTLTDDNCLYYFKSPKSMNALGLVLLPGYTVTLAEKGDSVGKRPFAFKAFNRLRDGDREYIFAAENSDEMKIWMNVLSLACIAFGTGKASMTKVGFANPYSLCRAVCAFLLSSATHALYSLRVLSTLNTALLVTGAQPGRPAAEHCQRP